MIKSPYSLPNLSILLLLFVLSLTGCSKEEVGPTQAESLIIGRWQLQQTSGGIGGGTRPADPNNKKELVLTADGKAQFLRNGMTEIPTGYVIKREFVALTGKQETIIDFGSPLSSYAADMIIVELTATRLSLQEAYTDGQRYDYTRP